MPTLKLTEKAVAKVPAPTKSGKQTLYFDTEIKGFGLLVSGVSNTKSYIAQRNLPDGRTRRVTLGAANEITLDQARELAAETIHAIR